MAFTKIGSIGRGEVLTAGDLTAAPLTSLTMDVRFLENLSLGCSYTLGGGSSITQISVALEASYDGGSSFFPFPVNPDSATPPNILFADGTLDHAVSGTDTWILAPINVGPVPLLRLIVSVTGAAAAGDLLTIDAYGENETGG